MKALYIIFIAVLCLQCKKEEKISDGIVFQYDKSMPMKFQEFNEGQDEYGGQVIYVGNKSPIIPIRYYLTGIAPPPPPVANDPHGKIYHETETKFNSIKQKYFNGYLPTFSAKSGIKEDSIGNQNVKIEANINDIIPLYSLPDDINLKTYKAFPVFVKNISKKNLIIRSWDLGTQYEVLNLSKKWQIILNNNWFICGTGLNSNINYYSLKKGEIMIFGVPLLHGSYKTKMRIRLGYAKSNEFDVSVDPEIFKKQKRLIYLD